MATQQVKPAIRSIKECHEILCQPGGPFEIVETTLHGRKNLRVFKHAPKDIRVLWDMVVQTVAPEKEWLIYVSRMIGFWDRFWGQGGMERGVGREADS